MSLPVCENTQTQVCENGKIHCWENALTFNFQNPPKHKCNHKLCSKSRRWGKMHVYLHIHQLKKNELDGERSISLWIIGCKLVDIISAGTNRGHLILLSSNCNLREQSISYQSILLNYNRADNYCSPRCFHYNKFAMKTQLHMQTHTSTQINASCLWHLSDSIEPH